MDITKGIYKHFKGNTYRVIGTAKHSETLELHVIYVRENNPDEIWIRPLTMFQEYVEVNGKLELRFSPIKLDK